MHIKYMKIYQLSAGHTLYSVAKTRRLVLHNKMHNLKIKSMCRLKPHKNIFKKEIYFSFSSFLKNVWQIEKKENKKNK